MEGLEFKKVMEKPFVFIILVVKCLRTGLI